jgi:hypothetical protein
MPRVKSDKVTAFAIYALLLDEPNINYSLVWDSNKSLGPSNWPIDKAKAFKFDSYLEAWNRLLNLYKENKPALNRISFSLIEVKVIKVDDIEIDPLERIEEINKHFGAKQSTWE